MSEGQNEFLLPAPQLTVPATGEKQFPMSYRDWAQLKKKIENLKEPVPYLSNVGWTCVGVAAGSVVALLPWLPAYAQLSQNSKLSYAYITPLLIILAAASALIAVFVFIVARQVKSMRITTIDSIVGDMDAIYEPYVQS